MPDGSSDIRGYQGRSDLERLQQFASRALVARFPRNATWHPGDFSWQLMPDYDRPQRVQLWFGAGELEAAAMFEAPGKLLLEILPQREQLLVAMLARAERSAMRAGLTTLSVRVFDSDIDRIAALAVLGYSHSGPEGVSFRIDLSKPPPTSVAPQGFKLRDCVDVDPARRAAAHRDAWNDLAEIGLPDARSSFGEATYLGLRNAPDYDPTLDILVETTAGGLVANCIAWQDAQSLIGSFEPVGTHAKFRRRGLARLVVQEGLRRLKERGMRWGRVSTAHFNAPAIATYLSCGFERHDGASWWSKALIAR